MKRIASIIITLFIALGALFGIQSPASANCGSQCHGGWNWTEFKSLTQAYDQQFTESLCGGCDGRRITSDAQYSNGHKTIEYNNSNYSTGWVYISYDKNSNGVWKAHYKEWGTSSGWNGWNLPCGTSCP